MGRRAAAHVRAAFRWENAFATLDAALERALAARNPGAR
jgi:hypothetical protein